MSVDGNPPGREVDVVGLGHLEGSELAFARSSLQRVVDKRTKELISQYQASDNTQLAGEEAALREAEALLRSHKFEAFLRGFDRGEYFLVNGADVAPPIPEGYLALNVGVTHRGHPALCVIVIRKTNNGIDEIENLLQARRAAYLQKVAYQFNGKSDEERRRIIARYDANAEDDRQWRNVIFPAGLGIDRIRATLFVQ